MLNRLVFNVNIIIAALLVLCGIYAKGRIFAANAKTKRLERNQQRAHQQRLATVQNIKEQQHELAVNHSASSAYLLERMRAQDF